MNIEEIKKQAKAELEQERFREAVDKYKEELRLRKPFWDKFFPWKIVIINKKESKNV